MVFKLVVFLNISSPNVGGFALSMVTVVRFAQEINALFSIEITELGSVILVRPLQTENAVVPILSSLLFFAKVTFVRLLQATNAPTSIVVTLAGIVIFVNPEL